MTQEQKVIRAKVGMLELARQLDSLALSTAFTTELRDARRRH
ncbi:hypothetical protein [Burkholderia ubonensis]|nr:hypothetical protein [Burkholderia ubonensis]